jgi:hypothetical protein
VSDILTLTIAVAVCIGVLVWNIRAGLTAGVLAFLAGAAFIGSIVAMPAAQRERLGSGRYK